MHKLVTIIIPAYNCQCWIAETVKSALAQTYPKKEIVVVDDGSNDSTFQIAKQYESKIVKVLHKENEGVTSARNFGMRIAQGDYIQWLDADDLLDPVKIEKQVELLEGDGDHFLATGPFGAFYFQTERAVFMKSSLWQDLSPLDCLLERFSRNTWMAVHTWLMSRALFEVAGPWDTRLCLDEDGEYFCRIVSRSDGVKFVPSAKTFYRRGYSRALSRNRSDAAMKSLLLSMDLSINHLMTIEDSQRTRVACRTFLANRRLDYFPDNVNFWKELETRAIRMGGPLPEPPIGWKLSAAKMVFGWKHALLLKNLIAGLRCNLIQQLDKMSFDIKQRK